MGLYIEVPQHKGKAAQIMELSPDVERLSYAPQWEFIPEGKLAVCVVDNGPFEAAAVAYNKFEWEEFTYPDSRPKRWLLVPEEIIREHAPNAERYLGRRERADD